MTKRILVIEDDRDIADLVKLHLADHGFDVAVEHDGTRGLDSAMTGEHDLIVVDLMLPGTDGLEICRQVRNGASYTPLVILTARGAEVDRVLGLEIGADDYLAKPVSFRELVARVKAIFRRLEALSANDRNGAENGAGLVRGQLSIDTIRRSVVLAGTPIELTSREFDLLVHFAEQPGRVFTRSELVGAVWGPGYDGYEHTVNSHINRLRAKINRGGGRQRFIETVWGVGYRFSEDLEA